MSRGSLLKVRFRFGLFALPAFGFLLVSTGSLYGQSHPAPSVAAPASVVSNAVRTVAAKAYPEIKLSKLSFRSFSSRTNFFKSRFSICRFLTFRPMRHVVYFNPAAFENGLTEEAMDGIIAHELAHVLYYTEKNRLQLLGMVRLLSSDENAEFERRADIEAISRGYGKGLAEYRRWLFQHIPGSALKGKTRNYFAPDEILMISEALKRDPGLAEKLRRRVPRNKEELREILR